MLVCLRAVDVWPLDKIVYACRSLLCSTLAAAAVAATVAHSIKLIAHCACICVCMYACVFMCIAVPVCWDICAECFFEVLSSCARSLTVEEKYICLLFGLSACQSLHMGVYTCVGVVCKRQQRSAKNPL